jgi:hypothetical protein
MSNPGIRPRNQQPAAAGQHVPAVGGKKDPQQTLRVLSADGAARAAAPSIAMPRAKTELSELLAGDHLLCVRRRASATRPAAGAPSSPVADAQPQAESSAKPFGQQGHDSSSRAPIADADLTRVIGAWPGLSRNVRAAIVAMIRETAAEN